MLRRTMDATFLNEVANHPDVRPFLGGGEAPIDLDPWAANPENYLIEAPGKGGWFLRPVMPGTYDLHTLFLPDHRGSVYFRLAREALRYMFTETDCLEIVTQCPDDNPGARFAAATMGFRERFRREGAWETGAGVSFRAMTIDDWFIRDRVAPDLGRKFHEELAAAKMESGSTLPIHADDEAHDRAVGAACLMIIGGQIAKGVAFYNRWATIAGYANIAAVGTNLVDVRDAIVEVKQAEMRVLRVRTIPPPD